MKIKAEGEPIYVEQPLFHNKAFFCSYSNMPDKCHQFSFGEFIVHGIITWLDGKDDKDDNEIMTESGVVHQVKWHYNRRLNFAGYAVACKYDNNYCIDMPCCLLRSACRLAVDLSNCHLIQNCLHYRCEGGAAKKYTKYTNHK